MSLLTFCIHGCRENKAIVISFTPCGSMKTKVLSPPSLPVYCTYRTVIMADKGAATADDSCMALVTVSILASEVQS